MSFRSRRLGRRHALAAWAAVLLWMVLIFVLSSQEGGVLSGSGRLRFGIEKLGHFVVFGTLGLLVSAALRNSGVHGTRFWWTVVLCATYAVSDELHQVLVPGRTPTVYDVAIDVAGSIVGFLIVRYAADSANRKRSARESAEAARSHDAGVARELDPR
ncbi:MAG: VanZ family protein [Candidatus Limnocylindria bacterium]